MCFLPCASCFLSNAISFVMPVRRSKWSFQWQLPYSHVRLCACTTTDCEVHHGRSLQGLQLELLSFSGFGPSKPSVLLGPYWDPRQRHPQFSAHLKLDLGENINIKIHISNITHTQFSWSCHLLFPNFIFLFQGGEWFSPPSNLRRICNWIFVFACWDIA